MSRTASAAAGEALQQCASALLEDLVRIPSVSSEEQAAADFLAAALSTGGLQITRVGINVVAEVRGANAGADAPVLMLCSHLDTVPAAEGWSVDPWDTCWQDGVLRGLGANDAKASVAAMSAAGLQAAAMPGMLDGTVLRLAFVVQEETNNAGAGEVLAACGRPDAAVIGEPTALQVVRSQAGLAVLTARWTGRGCHAAHAARVENDNALLKAAREMAALEPCAVLDAGHPLMGPTTLVPAMLHSGDRHNRVPDSAEAVFDGRLTPPHTAADLVALLEAKLPSAEIAVRSERLRPVDTPEAHAFVRAALAAAGAEAAFGSNTMSDMALLEGVPAVKCGPGRTERSHVADEYVTREELAAGVDFHVALLPLAARALQGNA